jgi:hypothetical protein
MAGLRDFTVLVRCTLTATDQEAALNAINHGLMVLKKADLIHSYDDPIVVQTGMSRLGDVLEELVVRHECGCGGDEMAPMHEQSLSHISWIRRG